MTLQKKQKPTGIQYFTAVGTTVCGFLLTWVLTAVLAMNKNYAVVIERLESQQKQYGELTGTVNGGLSELSMLRGVVNVNGNRITKLETRLDAIKPNEDQFKVKHK